MEEIYIVATIFLVVIGVIGNGLIIIYFVKINKKKLQEMTPYHFLLTILAVADFVTVLGISVMSLNWKNLQSNEFMCKYYSVFFKMALPSYSIWTLVMISYERYCKMVYPFNKATSCLLYTSPSPRDS